MYMQNVRGGESYDVARMRTMQNRLVWMDVENMVERQCEVEVERVLWSAASVMTRMHDD